MNNWKKNVFSILSASTLLLTVSNSAFASFNMTTEVNSNNGEISVELASGVSFSVEDDGYYDDATLISEKSIHDTPNVYETQSGAWSYVQCSNMTAYYVADSSEIACSRFNKSNSDGYQKVGKAWAQVEYAFYNKNVPVAGIDGTFKVTCSDTGSISS